MSRDILVNSYKEHQHKLDEIYLPPFVQTADVPEEGDKCRGSFVNNKHATSLGFGILSDVAVCSDIIFSGLWPFDDER